MSEKSKSEKGRRNKRKGSNAERYYAALFRENGYPFCRTAREASKLHDDSGIDLVSLPILAQIKAGRQKGMNISKVIFDIENKIRYNFPEGSPETSKPIVVIHYKEVGAGRKRTKHDELVTMTFETFLTFLKLLQ